MSVKLSARNSDEEENSVKIEVEIKTKSPLYKGNLEKLVLESSYPALNQFF